MGFSHGLYDRWQHLRSIAAEEEKQKGRTGEQNAGYRRGRPIPQPNITVWLLRMLRSSTSAKCQSEAENAGGAGAGGEYELDHPLAQTRLSARAHSSGPLRYKFLRPRPFDAPHNNSGRFTIGTATAHLVVEPIGSGLRGR